MSETFAAPVAPTEPSASRSISSSRANYALAVLTVIYVLNYADRTVLSLLLDSIKKDFHLSDTVLGLISGFGFVLFYSVLGLPIARWADRYSRRFILATGLVVWSAATFCSGLARNGWQLAITRFGVGAGEAGGIAPSHSMLADLFPKGKLPRALAILTAGSQIGVFVGAVLAGYVNQHYGWRMAFFAAGLPGIAVAILFRLTVREPARGAMEGPRASANLFSIAETVRFLLQQRSFVFITLGGSLMAVTFYGFQVWTPAFLHRVRHLNSATIGAYQGTVSGIFGVTGVLIGGFLAERLGKRDVRWRVYVPALAAMLAGPADLLFLFMPSLRGSLFFWAVAIMSTAAYMGPTYAVYQNVSKVRMRAFASATFLFCGNVLGLGVGSWLIGAMSDSWRSQHGDEAIRYALAVASVIAVAAGALFWVGSRYVARDIETAES